MKLNRFLISVSAVLISFLPMAVFAVDWAGLVPCGGKSQNPCTVACFYVMVDKIINFILLNIAAPLATTALMVSGIMLLFSSSEQSLTRGKEIFKFTIVGLILAFAAWLIIDLILRGLLQGPYLPWTKFPGSC